MPTRVASLARTVKNIETLELHVATFSEAFRPYLFEAVG